jgi:voltage-gated potassium channel
VPGYWTYRLLQPFIALLLLIFIGIMGYIIIEGYSFMEAIYMTTIAITTAGFNEVKPLGTEGRLFTVFLLSQVGSLLHGPLPALLSLLLPVRSTNILKRERI